MRAKVMISSTAHDLPEHRKAVSEACRVLHYEPVMMEDLSALDATAIEASLAMVDEADVYLGIFAHRYGHIPTANNPHGISITEMEYRRAVERRKPRLIFIVGDTHDPALAHEADPQSGQKLAAFKQHVMGDRVVKFFTSPDHLRALVSEALAAWEKHGAQWMPEPLPDPGYLPQDGVLPPGSRVLVGRAEFFVGREDVLVDIAQSLLHSPEQDAKAVIKPAVATGAGGIGKTVLAVEFAHRYGRYFYGVHWINLFGVAIDDLDTHLRAEIAANGQRMALPNFPQDDLPRQVQMTMEAWRHTQPRLLILDNAENPQVVRHALRLLPGLRVLVTSRWGEDGDWRVIGVTPRPLDTLTRRQSLVLLRDLAPHLANVPDADLSRLAARLGDYPLALHLAGRYIDRMRRAGGISIDDYIRRLDAEGMAHPAFSQSQRMHDPALAQHHGTVAHTLGLSWEHVTDPLAQALFRACGYLAPNTPIPPDVLLYFADDNQEALALALTQLVQYGLLAPYVDVEAEGTPSAEGGERLAIHPLLADFARGLDADQPEDAQQLPQIAKALAAVSKLANDTGLPAPFFPLRPHVEAAAERADAAGLGEAALLWANLGYHQRMIADFAATRRNYERALAIGERVHGPDHPYVASYSNNLGRLLHDLGDLDGARRYFERALAIDERVHGPDHPNVAIRLNNVGLLLHALGDLRDARDHLERALAIWEQALGPEHQQVATGHNNLGMVLHGLGDLTAARQHFEHALGIDERIFGPNHPNVAIDLNNLGSLMQALGDLPAALRNFERALAIDEAVYGPDHPDVAIDLNNLGIVRKLLGDMHGARQYYERALVIDERVYGSRHPNVAIRLSNLGSLLEDSGDLDGARRLYERALHIREQVLPPGHPKIGVIRRKLHTIGSGNTGSAPTMNQLRYFLTQLPGERATRRS